MAKPPEPEQAYRRLGVWILKRLDVFLSEPLSRAAPEDLGRYRVLVSISLFFLVNELVSLAFLMVSHHSWVHGTVEGFSILMNLLALVLLRRRASHELSAMLVCTTIAASFIFTSITSDQPYSASHAAAMLVPALSVYLMGARQGLVFAVLLGVFVGIIHPLHISRPDIVFTPLPPNHLWLVDTSAAVCILLIWVVSWLHTTARRQALSALRESERELHSLIENTDDMVCSIDTRGRIIVINSALRRVFHDRFGREPLPGDPIIPRELEHMEERLRQRMTLALSGQSVRVEDVHTRPDGTEQVVDISFKPIFGEDGRPLGLTLFGRDVTERKEAELKLSEMHRTLLDVSRQAGMAEMATGLLHNVGNTLNSVNVSASIVTERLQGLRLGGLTRAAELLREHEADLCAFLSRDPRGRQLPAYLIALSQQLAEEQRALLAEQRTLTEGLEHVKSIVSMQQEHARFSGMVELIPVPRLIDDALRLHATSFERAKIEIRREYAEVPPILLDRHKLMQIILNLLSNARHALVDSGRQDKRLTIRVQPAPDDRLRIQVSDNGKGIAPEHLARLFTQGFTTKKDGHGFGLHISALAAIEMAGSLTCDSEGPGYGATFTIELPMQSEDPRIESGTVM